MQYDGNNATYAEDINRDGSKSAQKNKGLVVSSNSGEEKGAND